MESCVKRRPKLFFMLARSAREMQVALEVIDASYLLKKDVRAALVALLLRDELRPDLDLFLALSDLGLDNPNPNQN